MSDLFGPQIQPRRVQRIRGQKLPSGSIFVGKSPWKNPFEHLTPLSNTENFRFWISSPGLAQFRNEIRRMLRGKDLACWCPLDQPCHADVLLELANKD